MRRTNNSGLSQMIQLLQQQMSQQQQLMTQILQYQQQPAAQLPQHPQQPQHPQPPQQSSTPTNPELILEALASNISEFRYDAESGATFKAWFERYEDLFLRDASRLDDGAKVRLLGRKLGTVEHARYTSFILPRAPRDSPNILAASQLSTLKQAPESIKYFSSIFSRCSDKILAIGFPSFEKLT